MIRKTISLFLVAGLLVSGVPLSAGERSAGVGIKAEFEKLNATPSNANLLARSAAGTVAARIPLSPAERGALTEAQALAPGLLAQRAGADKDVDVVDEPPFQPKTGQEDAALIAVAVVVGVVLFVVIIAAASAPAA